MLIRTNQGPWVSRFGSHLVAGIEDVEVLVDGVRVRPDRIDPYEGMVWLADPIRSGAVVEVRGLTAPHAVLPFLIGMGRTGKVGAPIGPVGSRSHYTIRVGQTPLPNPIRFAHRYWAVDRSRSSLLGDPVGLRTGRTVSTSPPTSLRGPIVRVRLSLRPDGFDSVWSTRGPGKVFLSPTGVEMVGMVWAGTPLPVRAGSRSILSGRVALEDRPGEGWLAGLVLHDGGRALQGGVYRIGEGWHLGVGTPQGVEFYPRFQVEAISAQQLEIHSLEGVERVPVGGRFQILEGPQRGDYRVLETTLTDRMRTRLTISPSLPAPIDRDGGKRGVAYLDLGRGAVWVLRVQLDPEGAELSAVSEGHALIRIPVSPLPAPEGLFRVEGLDDPLARGGGFFGTDHYAVWGAVEGEVVGAKQPDRLTPVESPIALPLQGDWVEIPPVRVDPGVELTGKGGENPAGLAFLTPFQTGGQVLSVRGAVRVIEESGTGDVWWQISDGKRMFAFGSVILVAGEVWRPDGAVLAGRPPQESGFEVTGTLLPRGGGYLATSPVEVALPIPEEIPLRVSILTQGGRFQIGSNRYGVRVEVTRTGLVVHTAAGVKKSLQGMGVVEVVCSPDTAIVGYGGQPPLVFSQADLAGPLQGRSEFRLFLSPEETFQTLSVFVPPPTGAERKLGLLLDPSTPERIEAWRFPQIPLDPRQTHPIKVVLDPSWGVGMCRAGSGRGWYSDRMNQNELDPACPYEELAKTSSPPGVLIGVGRFSQGRVRVEQGSVRMVARDVPGEQGVLRESALNRAGFESSGEEAQVGRFDLVAQDGRVDPKRWGLRVRQLVGVTIGGKNVPYRYEEGTIHLMDNGVGYSGPVEVAAILTAITHPEQLGAFPVRGAPTELSEQTPPFFPEWFSHPTRKDVLDPDSSGRSAQFDPLDLDRPLLPHRYLTQHDDGRAGLVWIASDDPVDLPWWPHPPEQDDQQWVLEGEGWSETYRVRSDGTERNRATVAGLFRPRGGRAEGTPTMDRDGRGPLYVVAPADILPLIEILP